MSKCVDITGNKYGRLTVIEIGEPLIKKNGKKKIDGCANVIVVILIKY